MYFVLLICNMVYMYNESDAKLETNKVGIFVNSYFNISKNVECSVTDK